MKPCKHEHNITYHDLVQVDGTPFYKVTCDDCNSNGIIELAETENTFGLTDKEFKDFK